MTIHAFDFCRKIKTAIETDLISEGIETENDLQKNCQVICHKAMRRTIHHSKR